MATNHEELLDTIGSMTVLELSEFVDAFKDKFNVTAMAAPVAMPAGGPGAEAEAEEQDEFDVILLDIGEDVVDVEVFGLGLREQLDDAADVVAGDHHVLDRLAAQSASDLVEQFADWLDQRGELAGQATAVSQRREWN